VDVRVRDTDLAEAEIDHLIGPEVALLPHRRRTRDMTEAGGAYLYILPAVLILTVFHVFPILYVIWLSVHATPTHLFTAAYVGLRNFHYLVNDPEVRTSLIATLEFTLGTVPVGALIALMLAMLLFDKLPGLGVFRALVLLPFVTPVVATTIVWSWIFNPQYGFLDSVLFTLHLPTVNWFSDPFWAMVILVAYSIWHEVGFTVLIMLAGLAGIDAEVKEAARIDGANWLQQFRSVILPLMSPWIFFVLVVNSIGAFKVFTQVLTLTGGGPEYHTELTGFLIQQMAFSYFDPSGAAALSVAVLLLVSVGTIVQFAVSRRTVFYQ
jgi:multiple sugar transport system permease protein